MNQYLFLLFIQSIRYKFYFSKSLVGIYNLPLVLVDLNVYLHVEYILLKNDLIIKMSNGNTRKL